ncbi:MAG: DUF3710 domain-containing protein [Actinomycetales bacterium]|nr:MAG: DUF3710 domain-containing protein [Actinomycetales bacterium]HCL69867.1 DUF3710 domain-containing protein [Actinomycetota bacterium]
MGLFSRRKEPSVGADGQGGPDGPDGDFTSGDAAVADATGEETSSDGIRADGPWDSTEDYPQEARIDIGSLLVPTDPADPRVKLQVQADPNTGVVSQLSLVTQDSAVQVQPYAAPRTGGMWEEIRGQIASSVNKSGGLVEKADGSFGVELRAQVTGQDGKAQPARFCGVDGPRWFLRFVFQGKASRDSGAAEALEKTIRGMVVVRGNDAMPMGNALPLRVPRDETDAATEQAPTPERTTITLPERGPEITETR